METNRSETSSNISPLMVNGDDLFAGQEATMTVSLYQSLFRLGKAFEIVKSLVWLPFKTFLKKLGAFLSISSGHSVPDKKTKRGTDRYNY